MIGFRQEEWGAQLYEEVERQLRADLEENGVTEHPVVFDWTSHACGEGRETDALGGRFETLSNIGVHRPDGTLVAGGWVDFVHAGGDAPFFVFWTFLKIGDRASYRTVSDQWIPSHVWDRLPAATRRFCTTHRKWSHDPKVIAWRSQHDAPDPVV